VLEGGLVSAPAGIVEAIGLERAAALELDTRAAELWRQRHYGLAATLRHEAGRARELAAELERELENAHDERGRLDVHEYAIHLVAGPGCEPGERLAVVRASSPLTALDRYARREGFAGYSGTEMQDDVTLWPDGAASAPFSNYSIVAVPAALRP
jgi:hypothetical protein